MRVWLCWGTVAVLGYSSSWGTVAVSKERLPRVCARAAVQLS